MFRAVISWLRFVICNPLFVGDFDLAIALRVVVLVARHAFAIEMGRRKDANLQVKSVCHC